MGKVITIGLLASLVVPCAALAIFLGGYASGAQCSKQVGGVEITNGPRASASLPHCPQAQVVEWRGWGNDTCLYTCGSTHRCGFSDYDLTLVKWDTSGNVLWNESWGGAGDEYGFSVWGDGTYIYTCGITHSYGIGGTDSFLLKWDSAGHLIWSRTWGGPEDDFAYYVRGLDSYGTALYTVGKTWSYGAGDADVVLLKWDPNGTLLWNQTWGGMTYDSGISLWANDTAVYTCGRTASIAPESNGYDLVLIKWDANGTIDWNTTWGGSDPECGNSIWGDGTCLYTCGYTQSFGTAWQNLALVKWDAGGTMLWNQTWSGEYETTGWSVWGDGTSVYTCGQAWNATSSSFDLFLAKWDTNGNAMWNRTWGGAEEDCGYAIWGIGSSLYSVGYTASVGAHHCDCMVLKWDATGSLSWYGTWGNPCDDPGNCDFNFFFLLAILIGALVAVVCVVLVVRSRSRLARAPQPRDHEVPYYSQPSSMPQGRIPPPVKPSDQAIPIPYCPNCGNPHPPGENFCKYCGTPLKVPE